MNESLRGVIYQDGLGYNEDALVDPNMIEAKTLKYLYDKRAIHEVEYLFPY